MIDAEQTAGRGGATRPKEEHTPLDVSRLRADEDIPFDLYVKNDETYLLFRRAHHPLTVDDLRAFKAQGIREFFVDGKGKKNLARFLALELAVRLKDPSLPLEEKAVFLMDASRIIMDDLFAHPESPGTLEQVRNLVEQTVGFISSGRQAFRAVIRLCSHDYYTYTHTLHVEIYSVALARQLNLSRSFLQKIGEGALLHDIGKALVPPEILTKPGPLTPEEWAVMKQHPQLGIDLLAAQGPLDEVMRWAIIGHHERLDGRGYPYGLKGDELALPARIVALADVYDALTTNRSYHGAVRSFEAFNIIKEHMTGGVDADLFRELVILMARTDPDW